MLKARLVSHEKAPPAGLAERRGQGSGQAPPTEKERHPFRMNLLLLLLFTLVAGAGGGGAALLLRDL